MSAKAEENNIYTATGINIIAKNITTYGKKVIPWRLNI